VNPPVLDAMPLEVLNRASSLDLFQLISVIERTPADQHEGGIRHRCF
jgi:hypothetical protein